MSDDGAVVHRRTIEIEVAEEPERFVVVARLRDDRPWAEGTDSVTHLHDMTLHLEVRRSDLCITAARADMARFPHAECPAIEPAFGDLVGLNVARGYTRAVQERFGRQRGCSHLEFLARAIGPAVVQAIPSSTARRRDPEAVREVLAGATTGWLANTCHVWAEDGPGPEKIALGWRPGDDGYPAPSAVTLRRSARA